ncbi:MAG: PaaI family thioesterase [Clostridia bacterium]
MIKKVVKKHNNAKYCIVCGVDNSMGLHARFYEMEDGTMAALASASSNHQSYPGRVHGGVITALLDETIGRVINIPEPETWVVTGELAVRFKKPVPYDVPLLITSRLTSNSKRMFEGEGEIRLQNGDIAASATGKYVKLALDAIADFEAAGDSWERYDLEDDPAEIDIP